MGGEADLLWVKLNGSAWYPERALTGGLSSANAGPGSEGFAGIDGWIVDSRGNESFDPFRAFRACAAMHDAPGLGAGDGQFEWQISAALDYFGLGHAGKWSAYFKLYPY